MPMTKSPACTALGVLYCTSVSHLILCAEYKDKPRESWVVVFQGRGRAEVKLGSGFFFFFYCFILGLKILPISECHCLWELLASVWSMHSTIQMAKASLMKDLKHHCSCSSSRLCGVIEGVKDKKSQGLGPNINHILNLWQLLVSIHRSSFICERRRRNRWLMGFHIMVPLDEAGSYS